MKQSLSVEFGVLNIILKFKQSWNCAQSFWIEVEFEIAIGVVGN